MVYNDSEEIPISFGNNITCRYVSKNEAVLAELSQKIDDNKNKTNTDIEALYNYVDEEVNILPFFKKWYNTRLFPDNNTVPSIYTGDNRTFLSSARYADDADDFPNGTVLSLTINDGYRYIIYIFDCDTKKIITQYNEKTYMKKEIVSDRDELKIYILLYRQDQNDIQISEAQNVKGYVYQNDLQKKAISIDKRVTALESKDIENTSVFTGKTMVLLGDSLTEKNQHYTKGYYDWVKEILGIESYTNYGISGSKISGTDGMCTRYLNMKNANLVVVMGGTNDCNFSVDFGTSDSDDINTLYGALKKLCKGLKDKYPTSIVVFITPHYQTKYPHNAGHTAMDVSRIIKEVCNTYAIPVYDNNQISGICKSNLNNFTVDNCHWNDTAHEMVGKNFAKWLSDTFRFIY